MPHFNPSIVPSLHLPHADNVCYGDWYIEDDGIDLSVVIDILVMMVIYILMMAIDISIYILVMVIMTIDTCLQK